MNVLVPVSFSRSIDRTVEYAADRLPETEGSIHLVHTETPGRDSHRERHVMALFERTRSIATRRGGNHLSVETAYLARDQYLSSPHDHASVLARYARRHAIDLVVLDPGFSVDATDPILQPVRHAFNRAGLPCEVPDIDRSHRPPTAEVARFLTVTGMAFAFWIAVHPVVSGKSLLAGFVGALLAGLLFRNVVFETTPQPRRAIGVIARGLVFVPYLLVKILLANVQISYVILHPDLPIDPHIDRIETGLTGGMTVTGLANSLTLTPGTLTVDAVRDELVVHSITPGTRHELHAGARQRAIEFVYYGRRTPTSIPRPGGGRVVTEAGPTDANELVIEDSDD